VAPRPGGLSAVGRTPARRPQTLARHRLDIALEGLARTHGGRGVDTVGEQRGGLGKALAQPILQALSLVAYTCRLGPSDPALAAAPQRCACGKGQCEGDKGRESRPWVCPVMIEPKRHLAKEIDDPNSEPPELHRSPSHTSAAYDGLSTQAAG